MSFYGKITEPNPPAVMKRFYYTKNGNENADSVRAEQVYFYESGHVGFWNEHEDGTRTLVLATKADEVWEDEE